MLVLRRWELAHFVPVAVFLLPSYWVQVVVVPF